MVTGSDVAASPTPQTGNTSGLSYFTTTGLTTGRPYGFQWTASAEL
jgi:hypothetical protein